ncbi:MULTISPECIES: peptidoglycan-binding protein [unclassified Streptomyces]|uniref:peptidoglycan-binding protein n=1 Tax=unclassified Streptomyces TaxID=2593676 RepID=UPI002E150EB0|nr:MULTISPECIES: peptidoglycan-binding protein [unclassified Streptomyces]WSR28376.1 peptidoglycan-binding protein [Streptomyces sp. NBC_01205]
MPMPAFEEYEPAGDCVCLGCTQRRRSLARARAIPLRDGGHPAARGARRALVLATAAGVVLGGGGSAALAAADPVPGPGPVSLDIPGSPQGGRSPLHGRPAPAKPAGAPGAPSAVRRIDRTSIITRAKLWLDAKVPYSMSTYWSDGYRQDCSGFVSMAWNLGTNEWTGSLDKFATKITKEELLPGDMLLFHNPADPTNGSHVVLFGGWVDETRTHYVAYEQTRPNTRKGATPYGYWNNATKYLPYRFNGVTSAIAEDPATDPKPAVPTAFPGATQFGPGANNEHVAQLARMLIDRGGRRFYPKGASTAWSDADKLATQAFQSAQGWTGTDADGIPGANTWQLLVEHKGNDIRPTVDAAPGPAGVPAYPGSSVFRPGASHPFITALGRQLVKKGFGKNYTSSPGPRWSEADRRSVEAFQRAQGWRGAEANGYPGPETWRRLFA